MPKKLYQFAAIVKSDWKNISPYAQPYLDAMESISDIGDMYFEDTASSVVAYFLANAGSWRGEVARATKKELNALLKS